MVELTQTSAEHLIYLASHFQLMLVVHSNCFQDNIKRPVISNRPSVKIR
jgi:hypothetical protein